MLSQAMEFPGSTLLLGSTTGGAVVSTCVPRRSILRTTPLQNDGSPCVSCASKESRLKTYYSICGVFPL